MGPPCGPHGSQIARSRVKEATCKSCIYYLPVRGRGQKALLCVNSDAYRGRITLTTAEHCCGNYRQVRVVNRPAVTQPTGSDIRFIPLTKGKVAVVDADDYDWLSKYKWYACNNTAVFRARRNLGSKRLFMHRVITDAPPGLVVDHIDGNPLNNRKANLRICTQTENNYNKRPCGATSRYKGVCWDRCKRKWIAKAAKHRKTYNLGRFDNEKDAARAYDKKAKELFGEFAYLNFK